MDNSVDLPGYKYYVDPNDGSRPPLFVAFLNLEPDASTVVNGVVFPVEAAELPELDARERNYERRAVEIDGERAWAYVGTADARARYETGSSRGAAVVDRAYLDLVRDSFAALGDEELRRYEASTDAPAVPVRALRRVELPPSA
jgi:hypothetical protein